jgi:hypothetical protein
MLFSISIPEPHAPAAAPRAPRRVVHAAVLAGAAQHAVLGNHAAGSMKSVGARGSRAAMSLR